jgi:hypothetical protein
MRLGYPAHVVRSTLRKVILVGALVAALLAGSAAGATSLADPIVGTWKVTRGGSGTFTIAEDSGVLAMTATKNSRLACLAGGKDFVLGFIDLPGNTGLPTGRYNGHLGEGGQGCAFNLALKLAGGTLTGTVLSSENDEPGGPFTFVKTSGASYRWTAKAGSIAGSGRLSVDARGKVTAVSGTLKASRWKLALRTPAKLSFGKAGAFSLTLSARVTSGNCSDPNGLLVLSSGRARLSSICGKNLTGTGSVALS